MIMIKRTYIYVIAAVTMFVKINNRSRKTVMVGMLEMSKSFDFLI